MTKLKCYELKSILKGRGFVYGYEVFKSGKDVKIRIYADEQDILDYLHEFGFSITPETIPTNGYYTVEW